jgi:hypothetical protein
VRIVVTILARRPNGGKSDKLLAGMVCDAASITETPCEGPDPFHRINKPVFLLDSPSPPVKMVFRL